MGWKRPITVRGLTTRGMGVPFENLIEDGGAGSVNTKAGLELPELPAVVDAVAAGNNEGGRPNSVS